MIPAALIGILATIRLGAIHTVVFGGFAANALAQRIAAAKPVIILTASCGIEGTKPPIGYKPFIKEAIEIADHRPGRILVWQREQLSWPLNEADGDRDWVGLARKARASGIKADCVPVDSNDAIYIIYTSGTTGSPKGVVRDAGGHAVGLQFSIRYTFGIHGPGYVMFGARLVYLKSTHRLFRLIPPEVTSAGLSDIHISSTDHCSPERQQFCTRVSYAPVIPSGHIDRMLRTGKPVGTPDSSSFWRIIQVSRLL